MKTPSVLSTRFKVLLTFQIDSFLHLCYWNKWQNCPLSDTTFSCIGVKLFWSDWLPKFSFHPWDQQSVSSDGWSGPGWKPGPPLQKAVQQLFSLRWRSISKRGRKVKLKVRGGESVYLLLLALQADQVSVTPAEKLARLFSVPSSFCLPFLRGWTQLAHTQSAEWGEKLQKMTTPRATAHGKAGETKRAREARWRACFIKVQVQDLSDCQAALVFWFHINVVSFLPLFTCKPPFLTVFVLKPSPRLMQESLAETFQIL